MLYKSIILVFAFYSFGFGQVPTNAIDICPLMNGENIPKSVVKDKNGIDISLNDVISKKPTVLIFFRGNWCPYCNSHLGGIQKIEKEIESLGYQTIAISGDKLNEIPNTESKNKLTYSVYSDSKMRTQIDFGIAYRNEETIKNYNGLLQKASGEDHGMLPVPSLFIINTSGKILFSYLNPNITERIDEQVVLAVLKTLKK
ncbi:MAG: peroxiredoxin-like family protein [Bacteroidota bacterium]|nr:peroxiredoxin-like family protein [Bacteroidota bacterium]